MTEKLTLEITDLHCTVKGKEILKGVNMTVNSGEIHAIMGPNGSGKSTLSYVIMGHPKYKVTKGDILLNGESILGLKPDKRAKKGLFLAMQYPAEIPGVVLSNFLRSASDAVNTDGNLSTLIQFQQNLRQKASDLKLRPEMNNRYLNVGFSGGEKKRAEILQMSVLRPKIAILDEVDSGLDIDGIKVVAEAINKQANETGLLIITHYNRIFKYITPDTVYVLIDGKVKMQGKAALVQELEKKGYGWLQQDELTVIK